MKSWLIVGALTVAATLLAAPPEKKNLASKATSTTVTKEMIDGLFPPGSLFAVYGYRDWPGHEIIDRSLNNPVCWKALGATSAMEARRSAERFGIQFADLSASKKGRLKVLASTDGWRIYWDVVAGNPFYDLMPLHLENAWRVTFKIRRPLTGRYFSATIFLHELGHRLGALKEDWDEAQNHRNTMAVIQNCVPELIDGSIPNPWR